MAKATTTKTTKKKATKKISDNKTKKTTKKKISIQATSVTKKSKKASQLDVAYKVLKEAKAPMTTKEIMQKIIEKKLWETKGKTPAATLYSAILREMDTKGSDSRFKKTGPGKFAAKS